LRRPKQTTGPSSPTQLPLPAAPKLDTYGLHAYDCECVRCELGARPSPAEREIARRVWERAEAAKREAELKLKREAEAAAAPPPAKPDKWQRAKAREEEARREIEKLRRPVERPATPEELDALKAEFGFRRRKGP